MQFKQAYRKAGVEFDAAELPDHLCVVLEFGAAHDPDTACRLLNDHRAGVEMLRIALAEKGSPWHDLLLALASTLPELKGEDEEKMIALIAQGPPSERSGSTCSPTPWTPGSTPPQRVDRARRHHPGRSALMDTFLFLIFPYLCLAVFVVGHYWRYKYDKFGWTTRSSQLYENRLLRWAAPSSTSDCSVSSRATSSASSCRSHGPRPSESVRTPTTSSRSRAVSSRARPLLGLVILVYRRRTVGPVFSATTRMDKLMYVFLAAVIVLGIWNTLAASTFGHYDYREDVSPWFRSIFLLQPKPELMADAALGFQVHALIAFGLFALWPFTRLVHVFSAPLGYVTRPYIVYRSRDEEREGTGAQARLGEGESLAGAPGAGRRAATRGRRHQLSRSTSVGRMRRRVAVAAMAQAIAAREWHEGSDDDRAHGRHDRAHDEERPQDLDEQVARGRTDDHPDDTTAQGHQCGLSEDEGEPRAALHAQRTQGDVLLAAVQQQAEDEDGDDVDAHERAEQQVQPDQGVRVEGGQARLVLVERCRGGLHVHRVVLPGPERSAASMPARPAGLWSRERRRKKSAAVRRVAAS